MDWQRFYITDDLKILLDVLKSELFYLKTNWNVPGRPLLVLVITSHLLYGGNAKLHGGHRRGVRRLA